MQHHSLSGHAWSIWDWPEGTSVPPQWYYDNAVSYHVHACDECMLTPNGSPLRRAAFSHSARMSRRGPMSGKFEPTWESLSQYETPEWFRNAKFGIWAHWGPQCQPEAGDWYGRSMYDILLARRTELRGMLKLCAHRRYGVHEAEGCVGKTGRRIAVAVVKIIDMEWVGEGPYRVWKNRMEGTAFGCNCKCTLRRPAAR